MKLRNAQTKYILIILIVIGLVFYLTHRHALIKATSHHLPSIEVLSTVPEDLHLAVGEEHKALFLKSLRIVVYDKNNTMELPLNDCAIESRNVSKGYLLFFVGQLKCKNKNSDYAVATLPLNMGNQEGKPLLPGVILNSQSAITEKHENTLSEYVSHFPIKAMEYVAPSLSLLFPQIFSEITIKANTQLVFILQEP